MIIAIDPGTTESAVVIWDHLMEKIEEQAILPNKTLLDSLPDMTYRSSWMVIEKVASYGMPVGADVFETVFWSGRFAQAAHGLVKVERITRQEVKMHLCHSMRAKDTNIRQALIDRYGEVGTKKNPGKLYGISKDKWAALAVAVTYGDKYCK
jgi:hypothetical protein